MRWWSAVCVILLASALVRTDNAPNSMDVPVTVPVTASVLGPEAATLVLQQVVMMTLNATGAIGKRAPTADTCQVPDDFTCFQNSMRELTNRSASVALIAVSAEEPPPSNLLLGYNVMELGDIMPPSRRACLATSPPARSLLDLATSTIAANYVISDEDIERLMEPCNRTNCHNVLSPDWCLTTTCATLLTSREGEAKILMKEVQKHHLYAVVRPLGEHLSKVTSVLADRPIIACDWAPELFSLADLKATTLGPPPCLSSPCPFETRRIVKYANNLELAEAPSAIYALTNINISKEDIRTLIKDAASNGTEKAASAYMAAHPPSPMNKEICVIVLVPYESSRETYDGMELTAAASLVEEDLMREWKPNRAGFKVVVHDDKCHPQEAYKNLNNVIMSDHNPVSALAGPACGAVWENAVQAATYHSLPVLSYTLQAPVPPLLNASSTPQLLAAGDAHDAAATLAAFVKHFGWKRIAVLNERATEPLLDAKDMDATVVVQYKIPENGPNIDFGNIQKWVSEAERLNARILYLCVEDARIARAAMCAARHASGLYPSNGAVWLICNTHKDGWLEAKKGENCTTKQLEEMAEGHFSVAPEWALTWQKNAANATQKRKNWEKRWRDMCFQQSQIAAASVREQCTKMRPGPNAAVLYDALRNWADALYRLLEKNPMAVDNLLKEEYVKNLVQNAVGSEYSGLTGSIKWNTVNGTYSREASFVLSQWNSKTGARPIGTWSNKSFRFYNESITWYTTDGHVPDDGSDKCTLQGLADALRSDCQTAFAVLCAMLVAILIAAVTALVLYCKKRTEKEYRKRLQALGMRPLAIKPAGLDRWEVPRERVVINRKLGTGAFGTVYGGHALLAEDKGWSAVAVKTLKAGATTEEKLDFLSEAEAMKRFDHKNIVRLLGVVTKTEPVCTVMEFMLYGDLKNYLLARRHLAMGGGLDEPEGLEADEASPRRLTGMALDVARALSYLSSLRYVHRDVAARNCLVSARRVVKLADFGMTRLVFENDYYRFSRKGMLPVRWMAPESLALGVFSPASDVWSFGVLLYEIVTFGSLPFQGLSNSEVLAKVKGGYTLDLPLGLKPQLESLITSCWQQDPKKRPTASELAAFLADAPRLLSPCLDVPLDALPLDADPPWRLPRDQAEARWVSWAAPASATTDTTYLSTDGAVPLDTDSFLP